MQTIQQTAQQQGNVPIEYVGKKPAKHDNVNHTNVVWHQPGDVQPYPQEKAAALLRYPDIWKLGRYKEINEPPSNPVTKTSSVAHEKPEVETETAHDASKAGADAEGSIQTAAGKRGGLE